MDPLVNELLQGVDGTGGAVPGALNFVIVLLASTGLNLVIAKTYAMTHGGYSYSKSFLQSIVLVGLIVSLIMVIIGSDIARAFALVGAMSIVRFRTPVKDSRDLIFIFAAIAVGMACGVEFFSMAAIFTAAMVALAFAFHYFRFGELAENGYVLRVQVASGEKSNLFDAISSLCSRVAIVSISHLAQGDEVEDIIYEVELKRGVRYETLIDHLTKTVPLVSVNILVGERNVSV